MTLAVAYTACGQVCDEKVRAAVGTVLGYLVAAAATAFAIAGEVAAIAVYVHVLVPANVARYSLQLALAAGAAVLAVYVVRTIRSVLLHHTVAGSVSAAISAQADEPDGSQAAWKPKAIARANAWANTKAVAGSPERLAELESAAQLPRKLSVGRRSATL